jgi:dihydrofolate reductase
MQTRLTLIVAATANNGIGKNGGLPWRLAKEMQYFARVTSEAPDGELNAVVMGRNTWESIPAKFRPLKKRLNIVISRNTEYQLCVIVSLTTSAESDARCSMSSGTAITAPITLQPNLEAVISKLAIPNSLHRVFVIGGASLYKETLALPPTSPAYVDRILLTRVTSPEFGDCDVFMPDFQSEADGQVWRQATHEELKTWVDWEVPEGLQEENGTTYEYQMWTRTAEE